MSLSNAGLSAVGCMWVVQLQIHAEYNQCQNGLGSKDECYGSSEKRKNYMDLSDQGACMLEVSLGYH